MLVGTGVFVGVSVGGIGVEVGMAAWVSAIIVRASAADVLCMSNTLSVGVASAPHALMISVIINSRVRIEKHFMWTYPYCFSLS